MRVLLALVLVTALAGVGVGRPSVVLRMVCDLGGVDAAFVAEVEIIRVVDGTWVRGVPVDRFLSLDLGAHTLVYGGEVRSPVARYIFTGRDAYADFTDMTTYARFRVQFVWQGRDLLMIVNPFREPAWQGRHLCRFPG